MAHAQIIGEEAPPSNAVAAGYFLQAKNKCKVNSYSPDIKKHKLTSHCLVSLLCLKNQCLERKFVAPLFTLSPSMFLSPTLSSLHAPSLPPFHPSMLPLSHPFISPCSLSPTLSSLHAPSLPPFHPSMLPPSLTPQVLR